MAQQRSTIIHLTRQRVLAAALAAVAVIAVVPLVGGDAESAQPQVDPRGLLAVFDRAQTAEDEVPLSAQYTVDRRTTRYLGDTPGGAQYAGVGRTGDLCLITVLGGETAEWEAGCVSATDDQVSLLTGPAAVGGTLLVADGYRFDPDDADDWTRISRNLYYKG